MNDKVISRIVTWALIAVSLWWVWMILDTIYDMRALHFETLQCQIEVEEARQKTYEMYQQYLDW